MFIDILDGTTGDGGFDPEPEMHAEVTPDCKIMPDSGIDSAEAIAACNLPQGFEYRDNASPYDGVRDNGNVGTSDSGYYEPDISGTPGREDGDGYSPNRVRNQVETGNPGDRRADVTVRDFPGLLEDAQEPFEAVGLGMPWYSAFGNHDALVQGNSGAAYAGPLGPGPPGAPFPLPGSPAPGTGLETFNPGYHAIAMGCLKPSKLPPAVQQRLITNPPQTFQEFAQIVAGVLANPFAGTEPIVVPPDPRRCFLAKAEEQQAPPASPCETGGWIEQHSRTTGTPVGHGFALAPPPPNDKECEGVDRRDDGCQAATLGRPQVAVQNHDGYYSFLPRPKLRFVVLDTVTDECPIEPFCSEGSIDDAQFQWLDDQIEEAAVMGQYVLVFSHHTLETTRLPSSDTTEYPIHFGRRGFRQGPGNPASGETLEELYCRSPNVLAHVDGHEHENFVKSYTCLESEPAKQAGGFTEISTAAHIDWPQQARMIELVEDRRQVSFVLTIIDHDGPAYPGGMPQCRVTTPPPADPEELAGCELRNGGQSGEEPVKLASIGREIAYNDYQNGREARGGREDRNVIIPTGRVWPPPPPPSR